MSRTVRIVPIAAATVGVVLVGPASVVPAHGEVVPGPLETVSVAVDSYSQAGWWTPIDEFDGDVYMAYNYDYLPDRSRHEVKVVRRNGPDDFTIDCLRETAGSGCTTFVDDRGHNQPSVAVDGDGYIHVAASMHNNTWRYYRSSQPGDPTTMVNRSSELPNQHLLFTYPSLDRGPDGDVWLIVRSRAPGVHTQAGAQLYHWHASTQQWTWTSFAFEQGMTVYPDDVEVTPDGVVHIAFQWGHMATEVRHEPSYLQYRPDTQTFHNITGAQVSKPVTRATPGLIYQPMQPGESYGSSAGVQNAKMALYQQGSQWWPAIAYRYRQPGDSHFQVRRARYVGGVWNREVIFDGGTHPAIGVSHDGSLARVYYAARHNGGRAYVAESGGGGIWNHTEIGEGNPVWRLAVKMRDDSTDLAYLVAPTAISPERGELYFRTLGRDDGG